MNPDILLVLILFMCGSLLFEVPSIIRQMYIEKHIKEKHTYYSKSKWTMTRKYCAFYGYDLETLQYDKKWEVRIEVVRKGYNLNHFLNDKHVLVRKEAERMLQNKQTNRICGEKSMKDDFKQRIEEESKLSGTSSEKERMDILYKRYKREQMRCFFDDLPLMVLGIAFLCFLASLLAKLI